MDKNKKGHVRIIEQPAESSHRFRYESEQRFNKAISGCSSTEKNQTYPKIEIRDYTGEVCVIISCVTKNEPYRQHPHKIFSTNSEAKMKYGIYSHKTFINGQQQIVYDDIGIMFVKRADAANSLKERKTKRINPFDTDWDHIKNYKDLNLRELRLCFQVIAVKEHRVLGSVVTTPMFDKKIHQQLKIITMSIDKGSTKGGDELIILCDKVRSNDLVVRVFEQDQRGTILWMKEVRAPNVKIHKQTSLVLNTPMYRNPAVETPRECFIQLFRPSNGTASEPKSFQYLPSKESIHLQQKKQRKMPRCDDDNMSKSLEHIIKKTKRKGSKNETKIIIESQVETEVPGNEPVQNLPQDFPDTNNHNENQQLPVNCYDVIPNAEPIYIGAVTQPNWQMTQRETPQPYYYNPPCYDMLPNTDNNQFLQYQQYPDESYDQYPDYCPYENVYQNESYQESVYPTPAYQAPTYQATSYATNNYYINYPNEEKNNKEVNIGQAMGLSIDLEDDNILNTILSSVEKIQL